MTGVEGARILYESLLVPVLKYSIETMICRENEMSTISVVQMDNFRYLLGIGRIDKVHNTWIRKLRGVTKYVDEKIDEGVFRWSGHVKRMENVMISMTVYVGECVSSHSVGRPKRWIDTGKDCLKKRSLDVWQVRRMEMYGGRGFVKGMHGTVPGG